MTHRLVNTTIGQSRGRHRPIREQHRITPRVRQAIQLYQSGAARTQAEAARWMGCTKEAISMAMNTTIGRRYVASLDEILTREYASASEAIHAASMRAVQIVGSIAEHGAKDEVRLKAASDLLDRNPATSKTQRMELEAFTLGAKDVQALAESLVKGKQLHSMFPEAANGNYIKTETFKAITPGETDAEV